ncbi:SDR family NAD(P)-dependent oxidoreductase [Tomitella biformata]|uniref:SDR family NAD(P)-dependent oxidoreductase n=1 Tax=Tomitella biformata TaxID=630403 RepID=UPI000463C202|nr:SDR family oxidoreductase [Tomitella biformata]
MVQSLHNKRILVTGAATGIGAATVEALTLAGAKVAATFNNTEPANEFGASWVRCDVTDPDSVDAAFAEAIKELGGLDVLIHAAGLWEAGIPGNIGTENLHKMMNINFSGTVLTNQAAHAAMRGSGGRIINFGSSEGVTGSPVSATYAASKAAVHSWTRSAAKSWAVDNVTVNTIAPAVQTPGADKLRKFLGPDAGAMIDEQLKSAIPLGGKLGDPLVDLGPVLVFLSSDGSKFITGQFHSVDGGLLMVGG